MSLFGKQLTALGINAALVILAAASTFLPVIRFLQFSWPKPPFISTTDLSILPYRPLFAPDEDLEFTVRCTSARFVSSITVTLFGGVSGSPAEIGKFAGQQPHAQAIVFVRLPSETTIPGKPITLLFDAECVETESAGSETERTGIRTTTTTTYFRETGTFRGTAILEASLLERNGSEVLQARRVSLSRRLWGTFLATLLLSFFLKRMLDISLWPGNVPLVAAASVGYLYLSEFASDPLGVGFILPAVLISLFISYVLGAFASMPLED